MKLSAEGGLLLTAGIFRRSNKWIQIWNACRDPEANPIPASACWELVLTEISYIAAALAGSGYIAGWHKRDDSIY